MNKQEVYDYLTENNIEFEVTEHKAVYNMAELEDVQFPYPEFIAKNLFIRDDKKRNYYLITVKGDKRVDLKSFRKSYGTRPLTLASEDDLFAMLGLKAGSVTPLGLLNDNEHSVKLFIDSDFFTEPYIIGVHPNENTATVWLSPVDLVKILTEHGAVVEKVKI